MGIDRLLHMFKPMCTHTADKFSLIDSYFVACINVFMLRKNCENADSFAVLQVKIQREMVNSGCVD